MTLLLRDLLMSVCHYKIREAHPAQCPHQFPAVSCVLVLQMLSLRPHLLLGAGTLVLVATSPAKQCVQCLQVVHCTHCKTIGLATNVDTGLGIFSSG